ncbi:hypothetical protein ACMFMG_010550 [Clarireedia jacksonii]
MTFTVLFVGQAYVYKAAQRRNSREPLARPRRRVEKRKGGPNTKHRTPSPGTPEKLGTKGVPTSKQIRTAAWCSSFPETLLDKSVGSTRLRTNKLELFTKTT